MGYKRHDVFEYDPVMKKQKVFHELDRGEEWAVETRVDVEDIVEANKAEFAVTDERARWGKVGEVWAKVASIPQHIYFDLIRRGVIDPHDDEGLLRWLSNRDNLAWRTRPGRLI